MPEKGQMRTINHRIKKEKSQCGYAKVDVNAGIRNFCSARGMDLEGKET